MTEQHDGGPAFPNITPDMNIQNIQGGPGMTLLDWFAGQALTGIIANSNPVMAKMREELAKTNGENGLATGIASDAYAIAAAMLKARGGAR